MANPQITTRVAQEIVDRLERLAADLTSLQEPGANPVAMTEVIRRLIMRALPDMEREVAEAQKKGAKPARKPKK